MFDFEKLTVYKYSKELNKSILKLLREKRNFDYSLKDQLKRASISIPINIAEGTGRFSKADRKNFYVIARGSTYECVSLIEIFLDEGYITIDEHLTLYERLEEISKMLLGLINSQLI